MANPISNVRGLAAFFRSESDAEAAIRDLKDAGFRADQIGVSVQDYDLPPERRSRGERSFWDKVSDFFSGKTGYEDRDTGSAEGSMKEGPVIGRTLTIPDDYRDRISQGGALVTVTTVEDNTRTAEAERILVRHNGEIERDFDRLQRMDTSERGFVDEDQRIQLLSEVLRVRKERVQRGEVRLRKEVVTETQNVQVPVSREEIVVERVPVEGQTATGDIGSEREIRVPLSEERATVEKIPTVREEVRVGKRAVEDTENISDETRREELRVEKEGDVTELDEKDVKKRKPGKAA